MTIYWTLTENWGLRNKRSVTFGPYDAFYSSVSWKVLKLLNDYRRAKSNTLRTAFRKLESGFQLETEFQMYGTPERSVKCVKWIFRQWKIFQNFVEKLSEIRSGYRREMLFSVFEISRGQNGVGINYYGTIAKWRRVWGKCAWTSGRAIDLSLSRII